MARKALSNGDAVTRHVGFCAICEGDFKLTEDDKLVHHGYKRPGIGYIVGDCIAVGYDPYEVSTEILHEYLAGLRPRLKRARTEHEHLVSVERGEAHYFEYVRHDWQRPRSERDFLTSWSRFVCEEDYDFKCAIADAIFFARKRVEGLEREVARIERHIAAWVRKPVRTLEEIFRVAEEKKAEARARVDAARAARDAKRAAIDAKHAAHAAKQEADRMFVVTEAARLTALLAADPGVATAAATRKEFMAARRKLSSTLNKLSWRNDKIGSEAERQLVVLGLGRMSGSGEHQWFVAYKPLMIDSVGFASRKES